MPTVDELSKRLSALVNRKEPAPLNKFTLGLAEEVRGFLSARFQRSFPNIQLSLRYGAGYRQRLRELGASEAAIEGSSGMYIGNVYSADIVIDLDGVRQFLLEGHVKSAVVFLSNILIEEFIHALFPKLMDREVSETVQDLVEEFLPGFKFTEEQKKVFAESISGEAKDGHFVPEFGTGKTQGLPISITWCRGFSFLHTP